MKAIDLKTQYGAHNYVPLSLVLTPGQADRVSHVK
jgi:hypothetical protein